MEDSDIKSFISSMIEDIEKMQKGDYYYWDQLTIYSGFDSDGKYVEIKRVVTEVHEKTKEVKISIEENEEIDENVRIVNILNRKFVKGGGYYDSVNGGPYMLQYCPRHQIIFEYESFSTEINTHNFFPIKNSILITQGRNLNTFEQLLFKEMSKLLKEKENKKTTKNFWKSFDNKTSSKSVSYKNQAKMQKHLKKRDDRRIRQKTRNFRGKR